MKTRSLWFICFAALLIFNRIASADPVITTSLKTTGHSCSVQLPSFRIAEKPAYSAVHLPAPKSPLCVTRPEGGLWSSLKKAAKTVFCCCICCINEDQPSLSHKSMQTGKLKRSYIVNVDRVQHRTVTATTPFISPADIVIYKKKTGYYPDRDTSILWRRYSGTFRSRYIHNIGSANPMPAFCTKRYFP